MEFSDLPLDVVPKWNAVRERMNLEYPAWQEETFNTTYARENIDPVSEYIDLYIYYLNRAALENDWDVYTILAYSIPFEFKGHQKEEDMKKFAVWCARVNGNVKLAEELATSPRFNVYPNYYKMQNMSDKKVEQILRKKVVADIESFGWVPANVRRVANNMYEAGTLHPETMQNKHVLSVLLGRDMFNFKAMKSILYYYMSLYPDLTLTDIIAKINFDDYFNSVRPRSDVSNETRRNNVLYVLRSVIKNIPKNKDLIEFIIKMFAKDLSNHFEDPTMLEAVAKTATNKDEIEDSADELMRFGSPARNIAITRGLETNPRL